MITEDYCSYELSKLLKERGFDEPCYGRWYSHEYKKELQVFDVDYEPSDYSELREGILLAPTHQMAMKWLRTKGIYIEIDILCKTNIKYSFTILKLNEGEIYSDDKIYTTYEEAVEAALKYCLTELI